VGIKKGSIMKNWKDNEKSSDTIFDNISIFLGIGLIGLNKLSKTSPVGDSI
jgi:hypothetical protein